MMIVCGALEPAAGQPPRAPTPQPPAFQATPPGTTGATGAAVPATRSQASGATTKQSKAISWQGRALGAYR